MRFVMKINVARLFHALGDPTRLKIIKALGKGETCGCTIIDKLEVTQPTMSYHLKMMTNCGLLTAYKEGTWKKHHLNRKEIEAMIAFLSDLLHGCTNCELE